MFLKKSLYVALFASLASATFAQGLILNDANLRTDLNWLNQQGVIQISTSTWPMSGDEIQRALSQAKVSNNAQQKVVNSVVNALKADNETVKLGLHAGSDLKTVPQTFGDNQKSQYQVAAEFNAGGENWDAKLRVNGEKDPLINNGHDANVEGSYLAGKLWNQWVIAGQIPTYWGPGHDGSLIRGDASRPVYGVTVQRAVQNAFETKWLSWIGPWQYQLFGGQLDDYTSIPDAKLVGMRLTAQPLPYLELGASRVMQWGGKGRPESLSSLWDAIKGNDNFYNDYEGGNQLAGFDARLSLQPLLNQPISIYSQMIGEDEAGYLPAKWMYLAGADFSSSYKNMPYQLYAEWTDTRTNGEVKGVSYTHHIYKEGYYQHGFSLGHSIGGDSQMYSVGGDIRFDTMNRLNGRVIYAKLNQSNVVVNTAFPKEDNIKALDLTWTHYLKPTIPLKVNGWVSDSDLNGSDGGVSVGVEIPLERKMFGF
ncbi:capsule assembly Wzi family protein [Acinetobacter sp. NIPH 1869]|uniref:capsule assembly Wzi family protein n=1 Tax=Acinetobacter higginsii TaxID=70347 RepID=UPI001F4BB85B|nr:capsule assembly Wzi family protein [Acinetobacter higginsii]MCH7304558.1 capsule assembly Wzi family protein [Acinetobacter higginsii]